MINKIRQYFTTVSILIMFLITLILSLIFGISDSFDVFYDHTIICLLLLLFTFPFGTTIIEFLLTLLTILRKPPLLNKYLHPIFEFIMIIIACVFEAIFYYFISTNFRDAFLEFNIIFGPIGLIISMSLFLISITILNIKSDFSNTTKRILISILSISTIYMIIFTIFNISSEDPYSLFNGEHIITILIILLYSILVPLNMIFITTREIFKNLIQNKTAT